MAKNLREKKEKHLLRTEGVKRYKGNYQEQIGKCEKIYLRVLGSMNEHYLARIAAEDKIIKQWTEDLNVAMQKQRFFVIANIKRMIDHRTRILWEKECNKKIEECINNGKIVHFLDDEDGEKVYNARMGYLLLMEAADSMLADFNNALHAVGIDCTLKMDQKVREMREELKAFVNASLDKQEEEIKDEFCEEADRLYSHLSKRIPVFNRKCDKIQERINKEKGITTD